MTREDNTTSEPAEPVGAQQGSRLGGSPMKAAKAVGEGKEDAARTAGLGFLMITGAKVWFMIMGAAVSIGLPMLMGPEQFGVYSIVTNAVSLVNMVVVTGALQAVAKLISEQPERGLSIVGQASLLQCFVGLPLGIAFIAGAPWVAEMFNDPSLTSLLRLSGGILLAYAYYAVFVGYFNGLKAFGRQAMLDVGFATLKTAFILGAVALGFGVQGAVGGFVAAAVVITFVALSLMVLHARGGESPVAQSTGSAEERREALRKLGLYLVLVMIYTFGVNGVLRADLFLLKSLLAGASESALDSDAVAGVYAAMLNLARLPYQAVIAVTFVVFPMISKATFESDMEATRGYIRGTLRYSFLLLALLGVSIAGNARELVLALYGERFVDGAAPLMLLSLATIGFALFFITTTMITGAGRPVVSVVLALLTMTATVALNYGLIQGALGAGEAGLLMNAAASATAAAMVAGCVAAVGYLIWRFKAGLPLMTLVRGGLGAALVFAALVLTPTPEELGRVALLGLIVGKGALGAALFVGWLALLREFGPEDMNRLKRVVRRKSRA